MRANVVAVNRLAGREWPSIQHYLSVTNPALHLCQEYAMRTGGYDERARVTSKTAGNMARFAERVEALGLDAAIRDVETCVWLSRDDKPGGPSGPCVECEEIRRA